MADIAVEHVSVDHGSGTSTAHSLTTDVGSLSSAFVWTQNTDPFGGGPTNSTSNANNNRSAALQLTATDEITSYVAGGQDCRNAGRVYRYTGSAGGEHEFITRYRGSVTLSNGNQSVDTVDLSGAGISDRNACVPFIGGITCTNNGLDWNDVAVTAYLNSSGNLVIERGASSPGGTTTVYVEVVEFTGSAWSVGHGISDNHDTSDETITLNTDSTGSGGSTFDVADWQHAFIVGYMAGDSSEEGLSDVHGVWEPAGTTTQATLLVHRDNKARNDAPGHVHVVRNDALDVWRYTSDNWAEGNGTYAAVTWPTGAPTSGVTLADLGVEAYSDTTGTGRAWMRGSIVFEITAVGSARGWVHRSGNSVRIAFGVIDLSGLEASGPTTVAGTAAGSSTTSATASGTLTEAVETGTATGSSATSGAASGASVAPTITGTAGGDSATSGAAIATATESVTSGVAAGTSATNGTTAGSVVAGVTAGVASGLSATAGVVVIQSSQSTIGGATHPDRRPHRFTFEQVPLVDDLVNDDDEVALLLLV